MTVIVNVIGSSRWKRTTAVSRMPSPFGLMVVRSLRLPASQGVLVTRRFARRGPPNASSIVFATCMTVSGWTSSS